MITELGLKGSELIAYALIYGLTIHESDFHGTAEYLSSWLGITPKKCYRVLSALCERGLLEKTEFSRIIHYVAIIDGSKSELDSSKTEPKGSKSELDSSKTEPNNIAYNRTNRIQENISADGGLFQSEHEFKPVTVTRPKRTSEPACLFKNSKFYDYNVFEKQFSAPEFNDIDLVYYYYAVSDWSAQKGKKMKDWIATARNFMRSDMEKNKVHRKIGAAPALSPDAIEYLKDMAQ